MLIASPTLRCPFFGHTLLLLVDHGPTGSFGLALNRPLELPAKDVLGELGIAGSAETISRMQVAVGGPVARDSGFVLFERGSGDDEGGTPVGRDLALSASADVLARVVGRAPGPRAALFLGYAGWSAGQLEREYREGSWIKAPVDLDLVFEIAAEERWRVALRRLGIDPGTMVAKVASA